MGCGGAMPRMCPAEMVGRRMADVAHLLSRRGWAEGEGDYLVKGQLRITREQLREVCIEHGRSDVERATALEQASKQEG